MLRVNVLSPVDEMLKPEVDVDRVNVLVPVPLVAVNPRLVVEVPAVVAIVVEPEAALVKRFKLAR